MPKCDICGDSGTGVLSTRFQEGKLIHYCEKCIGPIKENEQKRKLELRELQRKRQEEAERLENKRQEEIQLGNETRKQNHINIQNKQKQIHGETLIDKLRDDYESALNSIEINVKELIDKSEDMRALSVLGSNLNTIIEIHGLLDDLYSIIYAHREVLAHFNSKRVKELGHPLIPLRTQYKAMSGVEPDVAEIATINTLQEIVFNKNHWYIKASVINEIDYLLDVLPILIEPNFIPLEIYSENSESNQRSDRYISSKVKISVWRRDRGKCVECGTSEKLEYDHIIPVSRGGSNTERNVQLLCEKCNRQKSANIQ